MLLRKRPASRGELAPYLMRNGVEWYVNKHENTHNDLPTNKSFFVLIFMKKRKDKENGKRDRVLIIVIS